MGKIRFCFLLIAVSVFGPTSSPAGVFLSVGFAPPPLPIYEQPFCPGPDFIWTPGYWAYDDDVEDYYWVRGEWVRAPVVGYLWTPGYWGWGDGLYVWHAGYWGPHVGYYGGIDYGFGYAGHGYYGGRWDHGAFVYNTAVTRVNTTIIHNTYRETVVVNHDHATRVSFNGGRGGVVAKPTVEDRAAAAEHHMPWTRTQTENQVGASKRKELRASINHGTPPLAAVSHSPALNDRKDNARQLHENQVGASKHKELRASINHGTPPLDAVSHSPALNDRKDNARQLHTLEKHNQHGERFYPSDSQTFVPSKHPNHHGANAVAHEPRGRMTGANDRVHRGSQEFHPHEQHRDRKDPRQGEYR